MCCRKIKARFGIVSRKCRIVDAPTVKVPFTVAADTSNTFGERTKHISPVLPLRGPNLFLSCDSHKHCGHYKDGPSTGCYNPADLVKPDIDDPDQFFYFHSSGEARPRSGINTDQSIRAKETIRVFNLNCSVLKAARRRILSRYEKKEPDILETLMEFGEEDRKQFIDDEIKATQTEPYWTVIKHFFEKV